MHECKGVHPEELKELLQQQGAARVQAEGRGMLSLSRVGTEWQSLFPTQFGGSEVTFLDIEFLSLENNPSICVVFF